MADYEEELFQILKKHALDLWGVINAEDPFTLEQQQLELDNVTWAAINKIKALEKE